MEFKDMIWTYYNIFEPVGNTGLYRHIDKVALETEYGKSRNTKYIKECLINSGKYSNNIIVKLG